MISFLIQQSEAEPFQAQFAPADDFHHLFMVYTDNSEPVSRLSYSHRYSCV